MVQDCFWEFVESKTPVREEAVIVPPHETKRIIVVGFTARTPSDAQLTIKIGDKVLDKLCLGRHDNPNVIYGMAAPTGSFGEGVTYTSTGAVNITVYYEWH